MIATSVGVSTPTTLRHINTEPQAIQQQTDITDPCITELEVNIKYIKEYFTFQSSLLAKHRQEGKQAAAYYKLEHLENLT